MQSLIRLKRITLLGFKNYIRNGWLSTAATLMLTLTLLIITIFIVFNLIISSAINFAKEKIDISIYFNDRVAEEQIKDIQLKLQVRNDVLGVDYIDKNTAYKIFQGLPIKDEIKILVNPEDNILPRSLKIKIKDPDSVQNLTDFFNTESFQNKIDYISTKDNQAVIDRLVNMIKFSRWIGIMVSGLFFVIALIVIFNTIRLTIYARREEIEIMQLVGASWEFIRIPFLVEAFFYSLLATVLSSLILFIGFRIIKSFQNFSALMGNRPPL
ncbi:MAG: cell division transport system permease protein [Candidatus Berkelbacteria bacterium Licking1014_85]|uniref:Cell division protein FtsX n=1 Tax=Candidatus Berkelbacteria bacterium Licking1014_85 TaxID=2017148 RepID=A0A554LH81_9BACT|nr:MAG: cell division transport system permease protein [Candidatus Berkelbacteria bacterium Licking1014_85]